MMRAVVIQTAFIGDLVLTIPLIERLKKSFEVFTVTRPFGSELITKTIPYDKDKRVIKGLIEVSKTLKALSSDLLISPHLSLTSSLIALLSGTKLRVGFKESVLSQVYHFKVVKGGDGKHESVKIFSLLSAIGLDNDFSPPRLGVSDDERKWAEEMLRGVRRPIGVAPGSVWQTKRWTGWEHLFNSLEADFIIFGRESDTPKYENTRAINFVGKTSLRQFMALCSLCQAFIGGDTGLSHIASALGIPTIVIFGPTVPEFGFVPLGNVRVIQTEEKLDCRPCNIHGPKKCPEGHHMCMKSISPDTVVSTLFKITQS